MVPKRYNESELYDFAAQILLEEKSWEDFNFLTEDDKGRVQSIVSRGKQALAQKRFKQERHEVLTSNNLHKILNTSPVERSSKKEDLNKRRIGVTKLAQRAGFSVFPLLKIEKETSLVRRKLMEVLSRRLEAKDIALLFTVLLEGEADYMLAVVSENLAKDIQFHMENKVELAKWTDYDANAVYAKYSIAAATYLLKEADVTALLKEEVVQYLEDLFKQLQVYCSGLPKKLGINDILSTFDLFKWRKLAGLTPRSDMAILSFVIDKAYLDQILECLPATQKEDVLQGIQFNERKYQGDIEFFVKVLEILKSWTVIVGKLSKEEEEGS